MAAKTRQNDGLYTDPSRSRWRNLGSAASILSLTPGVTRLAVIGLLAVTPVAAQPLLDQHQFLNSGAYDPLGTYWHAQAFVPSLPALVGVSTYVYHAITVPQPATSSILYEVFYGRPDLPGALLIASTTYTLTSEFGPGTLSWASALIGMRSTCEVGDLPVPGELHGNTRPPGGA